MGSSLRAGGDRFSIDGSATIHAARLREAWSLQECL